MPNDFPYERPDPDLFLDWLPRISPGESSSGESQPREVRNVTPDEASHSTKPSAG